MASWSFLLLHLLAFKSGSLLLLFPLLLLSPPSVSLFFNIFMVFSFSESWLDSSLKDEKLRQQIDNIVSLFSSDLIPDLSF